MGELIPTLSDLSFAMDYVKQSKLMFNDGDFQWKNALAFDLHQRNPRLVAQWAVLCAERLLAFRFPARLPDLRNDLNNAWLRLASFRDLEDPEKLEYEIWNRTNRDAPQTAISKLFTAIRELHQKNNCVWASGAVIANLVDDDWGKIPGTCTAPELYTIVLQCYVDVLNGLSSNPNTEVVG